jgi:diguanylate cyclase (GGDEF)-like protein
MIGITLEGLLGPIYTKNLPYIRAAYAGDVQVFEREIPTPDGRIRHSLAMYTPRIVDGRVHGIFVHVADVTPLKTLEQELRIAKAEAETRATHDFLTGLPNRVLLRDRIAQALALSKRTHRMVAVLSVDMDDFKRINDVHGHAAGDRFLVVMAARLTHSLREADSVTRMGGDEFLVLFPAIESRAEVEAMAGRILDRVRAPLQLEGTILSPSCSVGIALSSPDGLTPEELIASSDRALYLAKEHGKNRYAFADHGGTP